MPSRAAIIIPSYNSADFLPATIASALAQTAPAAQIIVVDDGSTDHTPEVIAPFLDRVDYVRVSNGGVSRARNLGVSRTDADWLLFLDSDDVLLPRALETLIARAEETGCGVCYGAVLRRGKTRTEDQTVALRSAEGPAPQPARAHFPRSRILTPGSAVVRRALHEWTGGFVDGYQPMEDRDFWMKCGVKTGFAFCDEVVLDKTWREGSALTFTSRRITNGLRAQLAFFDWCRQRGVDTAFLQTSPRRLPHRALEEALRLRCHDTLPFLLAEAQRLGGRSFSYYRALLTAWWNRSKQ